MAGSSSQGRKCPIVKSNNNVVDDDIGDPLEDKVDELAPKKQLLKHSEKGWDSDKKNLEKAQQKACKLNEKIAKLKAQASKAWEDDQMAPISNTTSQQSSSPNASKVQPLQSGKKMVLLLPGLIVSKVPTLSDFVDPVVQALLLRTMCAIFAQYFNPIPLKTLALLFTLVQFCIAEWSNSTCKEASFHEKDVLDSYDAYLADIQKWASFNPAITTNKHMKLFKRACKSAGVETTNIVPQLTGDAEE
ncbi:hypothetical protein DXG03_008884 [Asterophora parasitica]|uniref:DUF6532 domain-containing protein n=1 Tax=Asterophora parasitica TaxID=117018 RepID=A0A9P7G3Y6_9AGAR|nr:hypothetical protein DXG03_008884 [Asterophora parasitica]